MKRKRKNMKKKNFFFRSKLCAFKFNQIRSHIYICLYVAEKCKIEVIIVVANAVSGLNSKYLLYIYLCPN